MAQNKGAIVRYRALDRCLRKRNLKYGIEELRHACEEALYDAFSERITVSRRQFFLDINHMESNAGYRADIERYHDGKRMCYRYAEPDFSIEKMPLTDDEIDQLKETILMLNRFKGLPHFEWMEEILSKFPDTFACVSMVSEGSDFLVASSDTSFSMDGPSSASSPSAANSAP